MYGPSCHAVSRVLLSCRCKALIERWVAPSNALISVTPDDDEEACSGRVVNIVKGRDTGVWELAYKRVNGPQAIQRVTVKGPPRARGRHHVRIKISYF